MINLAGRYANAISRNPVASAVAGGLGAAGLATLGNVVAGPEQLEEKSPARIGLEALGAGALGAAIGSRIPAVRRSSTDLLRNINAVSTPGHPGAQARVAAMSPTEARTAQFMYDALRNQAAATGNPREAVESLKTGLRRGQALNNTIGIPVALSIAGGLGGAIGGGIANIGNAVGMPIDPEGYGSSNYPYGTY